MAPRSTKELHLIAFLDGRPGHEKQTMGIIKALQQRITVRVLEIRIAKLSLAQYLIQLCRFYLPIMKCRQPELPEADLIIGAGSSTHVPMLLYKKEHNVPAIVCMNPLRFLRKDFDLCFIPEHDGVTEDENIMLTLGAPNMSTNRQIHKEDCGLILLGGLDPKSHYWDDSEVVSMVRQIVTHQKKGKWSISSSPRTPEQTVTMIKELTEQHPSVEFFDYKDTPAGWIERQYDTNSEVWVTADSISMIYEAITAGCRVGIFPMRWLREGSKFKRNEEILLEKKLVVPFAAWQQGQATIGPGKELNEAAKCADRILLQWGPDSAQI